MTLPAAYPAASRPAGRPASAARLAEALLPAAPGCASCGIRRYCALAEPASPSPPANCPFGPGPAGR